jgi:hypothetical protein
VHGGGIFAGGRKLIKRLVSFKKDKIFLLINFNLKVRASVINSLGDKAVKGKEKSVFNEGS